MKINFLIKLLSLTLIAVSVLSLSSCGAKKDADEQKQTEAATGTETEAETTAAENPYKDIDPETVKELTVKIVDNEGSPVADVSVQVFGEGKSCTVVSDENGIAVFGKDLFKGIYAGYQLSLESCPEGYTCDYVGDKKLRLQKGMTDLEIVLTKE